jgi:hypothetical protein
MPTSARTLRYQVLVVDYGDFCATSIPGLKCKEFGASPEHAIAAVRERALDAIQEYEEHNMMPSAPPCLTLAEIELPAPVVDAHRQRVSQYRFAGP